MPSANPVGGFPFAGQKAINSCRVCGFGIACGALQTSDFSTETLNGLYRFATLLFGHPESASEAILKAVRQCGGQLEQIRREKHSLAFLVRTLREVRAKESPPMEAATTPEEVMALAFSRVDEPGRSALALLYVDLFPFAEIASLLHLGADDLAEELVKARRALAEKWNPAANGIQP
jgi:hypothetical protein